MPLTAKAFFDFAHAITRGKNIAYFGGYRAAFAHVLRELYALGIRPGAYCNGFVC